MQLYKQQVTDPYPASYAETFAPAGYAAPLHRPRGPFGAAVAVAGLGLAGAGLFAAPYQHHGRDEIGYSEARELASFGAVFQSDFARFWWRWGLPALFIALIALTCLAVLAIALRAIGLLTCALALGSAAGFAIALKQTSDYESAIRAAHRSGSLYDHTGIGTWLGFAGLAVVALGGVLTWRERAGVR